MTSDGAAGGGKTTRYKQNDSALLAVGAGVLLLFLGFFVVPWVDRPGMAIKFVTLRRAAIDSHATGYGVVYLKWIGYVAAAGVTALTGTVALGAGENPKALEDWGQMAAFGGGLAHFIAMQQIYVHQLGGKLHDAAAGPWLILGGYAALLVAAFLGPEEEKPSSS